MRGPSALGQASTGPAQSIRRGYLRVNRTSIRVRVRVRMRVRDRVEYLH